MIYAPRTHGRRSGQVAPLVAILIIPLMGMLAFSTDLGYMVVVRTQLQNAADSAALAGAQQLMDPSIQYVTPGNESSKDTILRNAVASALSTAKAVGAANSAGGVSVTIADADVTIGYTAPDGTFSASGSLPSNAFPNTVKVTARRDSTQNNEVATFFGKVLGKASIPMQAKAAATNYTVTIDGPKAPPVALLPMTFDVNMYNTFLRNGTLPNNNLLTGSNGLRQIQMYPSIKDTGNFGLLSLNDESNDASSIRRWINNGLSQSDVDALTSNNLIPLSQHNPAFWDWSGASGFKAANVSDVNSSYRPGESYLLPLFTPVVPWVGDGTGYQAGIGQGSNYDYNISTFVSVMITSDPTDNKVISVRPSAKALDYTKVYTAGGLNVAGQPGTTIANSVFIAPRLTE